MFSNTQEGGICYMDAHEAAQIVCHRRFFFIGNAQDALSSAQTHTHTNTHQLKKTPPGQLQVGTVWPSCILFYRHRHY